MNAPPDPAKVRRVMVRATNWIGDIVMISPALSALRRHFNRARIEVVAIPQVASCLRGNPDVDEVLLFDRRGADGGALGLLRLSRRLRERRYDLAVIFQKAMGAALAARLAGIPLRVGLDTDGRRWLLTHPVPFTDELSRKHHLLIFSEVARAAGCELSLPRPFFTVLDEDAAWADGFLEEKGAGRFSFLISLHVSASKPPRAWHRERFAAAAARVAAGHNAGVILLGGPGDAEDMSAVEAAVGERAINGCGRSSIGQMAALISRSRIFLGNDSGPMHVAAALDVPVVAVFGPGDPDRTAAWSPQLHAFNGRSAGPAPAGPAPMGVPVIPVSNRYPCAPCRQAFFKECYPAPSGKPMCLESIGVDDVVAALEKILSP